MKNYLNKLNDSSYVVIPSLIDIDKLEGFYDTYVRFLLKVSKYIGLIPTSDSSYYLRHQLVIEIYKKSPDAGAFIYDTFNRHVSFYAFFNDKKILEVAALLCNTDSIDDLAVTEHQFFISPPQAESDKNLLGWHQDSGYFSEFSSRFDSLTCWFSLEDCSPDDGALWVVEGSHKSGIIKHKSNAFGAHKDTEINKRGSVYLDSEQVDENKAIQINLNRGDAAFIKFNTIHKSGLNIGDMIRYTSLARFSNIYGEGFINKYGMW